MFTRGCHVLESVCNRSASQNFILHCALKSQSSIQTHSFGDPSSILPLEHSDLPVSFNTRQLSLVSPDPLPPCWEHYEDVRHQYLNQSLLQPLPPESPVSALLQYPRISPEFHAQERFTTPRDGFKSPPPANWQRMNRRLSSNFKVP